MNELHISYRPADEESARKFVQWRYEPPYDIYNCPPEKVEELVQYNIDPANNVYAMFDQLGELVGYCSYGSDARVQGGDYSAEALDIGLMVKPELTGRGLGDRFARNVIHNGTSLYHPEKLRVTIAAFNQRALRTWEKNGFRQVQSFKRSADGLRNCGKSISKRVGFMPRPIHCQERR
jgi:RimJ/RimL family protein N-acetyltransferase